MKKQDDVPLEQAGGAGEVEPSDDAIVREIVYPHPIEFVWQALTDPGVLASWLMPNDFAPRLGHRFRLEDVPQSDWRGYVECEVVALDPPTHLAYTWDGGMGPPTLVRFLLTTVAAGTRLRLEHTGFAAGGPIGRSIRDVLDAGWGSNLLGDRLPAVLDRLDTAPTPPSAT